MSMAWLISLAPVPGCNIGGDGVRWCRSFLVPRTGYMQ
jgi:hypothetical protein